MTSALPPPEQMGNLVIGSVKLGTSMVSISVDGKADDVKTEIVPVHPRILQATIEAQQSLLAEVQQECIDHRLRYNILMMVKEAYRLHMEASEAELEEHGLTRATALNRARMLNDAAGNLPSHEVYDGAMAADNHRLRHELRRVIAEREEARRALGASYIPKGRNAEEDKA